MEEERVEVLKQLSNKTAAFSLSIYTHRISKNSEWSENVRQQGNGVFQQEKCHSVCCHDQMLEHYTNSICIAKPNSKELALGYGNRSAALIHLGKFEPCIQDIDRALAITEDKRLSIKLLIRKVKCLHILGSRNVHQVLSEAESLLNKISDQGMKKIVQGEIDKAKLFISRPFTVRSSTVDQRPEMLRSLNEKHATNDFSNVEIKYDEKYGRHLVATKNLKPGDVIYLEEPYVRFLNLHKLHGYCSHCFATTWSNIPCEKCGWTVYCSEKCQKEAWEQYHDIDCSVYPSSKFMSNMFESYAKEVAVKSLVLGLKEFGTIENLRKELEAFDKLDDYKKGFDKNGKIETSGFKSIYALSSNIGIHKLGSLAQHIPHLLKSIAMNTDLLGKNFDYTNIEAYKKSEDALFLGSLFLKLEKIGLVNGHQMWNFTNGCRGGLEPLDCWEKEDDCCSHGIYIAPVTGLLNHSCDPNAGRCYTKDHKVLLYALKPIKEGEQIFQCYLEPYHIAERKRRRKILSETYNFKCDCPPCHLKWPDWSGLNHHTLANVSVLDMMMGRQFSDMVNASITKDKTKYNKDTIVRVSKGIRRVLKSFSSPSANIISMLHDMRILYEYLYGLYLDIPGDECIRV